MVHSRDVGLHELQVLYPFVCALAHEETVSQRSIGAPDGNVRGHLKELREGQERTREISTNARSPVKRTRQSEGGDTSES